jgi:hypothetical protein
VLEAENSALESWEGQIILIDKYNERILFNLNHLTGSTGLTGSFFAHRFPEENDESQSAFGREIPFSIKYRILK